MPNEGTEGAAIENVSYHIRQATAEDTDQIRALIRSASVHSGSGRGARTARGAGKRERGPIRRGLSRLLSPVFSSGVDWRDFVVAVSDEGALIGCCRVRRHSGGIREVATISVDKAWRGRGIPLAGVRFMADNYPRPLWGTCLSSVIPLYQSLGAVEVVDPKAMPAFLRRRRWLFNLLLRLARRKDYLAVMVLAKEAEPGRRSAPSNRALGSARAP